MPPLTKQAVVEHEGKKVDVLVTGYADRVFVVLTEMGKFGTVIEATKTASVMSDKPSYAVQTLLGKRDEHVLSLYARRLIEKIGRTDPRPLLLAIGLKDQSKALMDRLLEVVEENKVWN